MRRQVSQKDPSSSSFLDKFLGKTAKVGKKGISGVIAEARTLVMKESNLPNKRPSIHQSQISRDEEQGEEPTTSTKGGNRESEDRLEGELVSSRFRKSSNSGQYTSSFSRDSTQSQKLGSERSLEQGQVECRSVNSIRTELKRSKFSGATKKEERPKYLYQTLLTGDAMRQFQLLTLIQQRFRSKN